MLEQCLYFFTVFFPCFNMAVKRNLAIKTLAEKYQALRDLENGIFNKNVAEKIGCRRTLLQPGLNEKKNFLLSWKNFQTNAKKLGKTITQT